MTHAYPTAPGGRLSTLLMWSVPLLVGLIGLAGVIGFYEFQRFILQSFAVAALVQAVLVAARVFTIGWLEVLTYLFHTLFIGGSCIAVAFDAIPYPHGSAYEQLAIVGLAGQFAIGYLALRSRPLLAPLAIPPVVIVAFTAVCCTAAIIKFYYYYQAIGALGGHLAIYTDGEELRDATPTVIRIVSAAAPFAGILALTQRGVPWWCRVMGLFAIGIEFAIGTRGRPLFLLAGVLVILQHQLRLNVATRIALIVLAIISLVGLIAIGYVREDYNLTFDQYMVITFNSLFSTFEASALGSSIQARELVITQLRPLMLPTDLSSIDTVSKAISSSLIYQAYIRGFGMSSSVLLEIVMLFGPMASCVIYPMFAMISIKAVRSALTSRSALVYLVGIGVLPITFYIWRAELWQFVVPVAKALPFLILVAILNGHVQSLIRSRLPRVDRTLPDAS